MSSPASGRFWNSHSAPYNTRPMSRTFTMSTAGRLLALAYVIAALLIMQALRVHGHAYEEHHQDHTPHHTHPVQVHLTYVDDTAADDTVPGVDLTSEGIVDDNALPPLLLALLTGVWVWPVQRPLPAYRPRALPTLRHRPASPPPARGPPPSRTISVLSVN